MIINFKELLIMLISLTTLIWVNIGLFYMFIKAFGLNPNGFDKRVKKYSPNQEEIESAYNSYYSNNDYLEECAESTVSNNAVHKEGLYEQMIKEFKPVSPDMPSIDSNGFFDYDEYEYTGSLYDDDVEIITDEVEKSRELTLR